MTLEFIDNQYGRLS